MDYGYPIAALIAYVLGSSNMAYYLSKIKKIDIRRHGTGNLGASNSMILLGWKAGIIVGVHDIGKAMLSVLICGLVFPALPHVRAIAGACCILGHMFPFYLKFRGGKGLASYIGAMAMLDIRFALAIIAVFFAVVFITDYIVVGTMLIVISFPIWCVFVKDYVSAGLMGFVSLIIIYKHRENLKHIADGTERGLRRANRGEYRINGRESKKK